MNENIKSYSIDFDINIIIYYIYKFLYNIIINNKKKYILKGIIIIITDKSNLIYYILYIFKYNQNIQKT